MLNQGYGLAGTTADYTRSAKEKQSILHDGRFDKNVLTIAYI